MNAAIIVLLVVSQGDVQQPSMGALTKAAEQALGSNSRIVLHEPSRPLSDGEAVALVEQMRATVVVELTWSADKTRAHLHVHFAEQPGWLERELAFSPSEPLAERGRTLGFTIASMVPDAPPNAASPGPTPMAPLLPAPPPAPGADRTAPPELPARRSNLAADISGIAATGGEASGFGLAASARWITAGGGFIRAGGAARFGDVGVADASSTSLSPSLGVGWISGDLASRVRAGVRADGFAQWIQLSRSNPRESRARWVPGAALLGELAFYAHPASIAIAVGAEYAFGSTEVRIGQSQVAMLPPLRLVGELGLRVWF